MKMVQQSQWVSQVPYTHLAYLAAAELPHKIASRTGPWLSLMLLLIGLLAFIQAGRSRVRGRGVRYKIGMLVLGVLLVLLGIVGGLNRII